MPDDLRPPTASEAKVAYHVKQLLKMFARANDVAFLQMIWAVDALQSGREPVAKSYFSTYPPEAAAKSSIQSPFGIHRWELETLVDGIQRLVPAFDGGDDLVGVCGP